MVSSAILRVSDPSSDDLQRIVRAQTPVILAGLFRDQPIGNIASLDRFSACLWDVTLRCSQEYSYNEFEPIRYGVPPKAMSLVEYLRVVESDPATSWMCVEDALPDEIQELFTLPLVLDRIGEADDDLRFRLFVGNSGNRSSMHFDAHMRSSLLHQICGDKQVVLVSPTQSSKLLPMMNFSGWMVHHMGAGERADLLSFVDARVGRLLPGETLFIPTAWWHHVEYKTFAASFSVGLRRDALPRLLGSHELHWTHRSAAIGACAAAGAPVPSNLTARLRAVLDSGREADDVFDAVEAIYADAYRLVCTDHPCSRTAALRPIPERMYWTDRLARGLLYAPRSGAKD